MSDNEKADVKIPQRKKKLGNQPFPFAELPVELSIRILTLAIGPSQQTYRSLLLLNKPFYNLILSEKLLQRVSVLLSKDYQILAFHNYLKTHPEAASQIRALWLICLSPRSCRRVRKSSIAIIDACINVRALACTPEHLMLSGICSNEEESPAEFKHTRCVELTLNDFDVTWPHLLQGNGLKLFNQLSHLNYVGSLPSSSWSDISTLLPTLPNLTRASVAINTADYMRIPMRIFTEVLRSPNLQQLVVTTTLNGDSMRNLSSLIQNLDERCCVMHRRRRWKEKNMWLWNLEDPERFWRQAKEERNLPPPPNPLD
ncbi:hypothetical protein R3P38DRAFT_1853737 [Favolaschia claudopus]|uniref:F-box domain-containing protein n=1 Tax=Favolaschia claudopus TaxID=2862362 RepID=A0AAW0D984_9AGAR